MCLRNLLVLLLAFAASPQSVADSVNPSELYRIVTAYFQAIGENRLEEAMSFYHDDSPQASEARGELEFGRSAYLQRTTTTRIGLVHHDGERAVIMATHRHLRISGIKFMEELTEARYVMRRQGASWKLWTIVDRPLRH